MISKRWTVLALVFGLVSAVLNVSSAALFFPSLMRLLFINQEIPILNKIDSFAKKFFVIDQKYYFCFFSLIFLCLLLKSFFLFLKERVAAKLVFRHSVYLKQKALGYFNQKTLGYFVREGSSVIHSVLESYLYSGMLVFACWISIVIQGLTLILAMIFLLKLSWSLSFLVALLCIPLYFVSGKLKKSLNKAIAVWGQGIKSMNQEHLNFAAGIRFLKLSNQQEKENSRIMENSKKALKGYVDFSVAGVFVGQINEVFGVTCVFVMALVFYTNPWRLMSFDSGVFFSYLMVLARGVQSYSLFQNNLIVMNFNKSFLHKIEEVLSDKSEMEVGQGSLDLLSLEDSIQVECLSFVYAGTQANVLNSININLEKGKHLALVGPSGSGKSTLADLLLGFYKLTSGQIKINGRNYKDYKLKDYRKLFGLVSQEATMFFPTIRENLILFNPEATDLEIHRALDSADALGFVNKLPDGIDTVIGERGIKLSGGQKQRLSIARALLHNPEILIFDEATSSLDSLSEARIIESIKKASVGRTSITIAHRLSTVMHCDKVIFLENGWIVEEGSPQELMQKQSRFRKYAESQNLKMSG